jgi:MipA family protein
MTRSALAPTLLPALSASLSAGLSIALCAAPVHAQTPFPDRFVGDLGLAAFAQAEIVRDTGTSVLVLPYVYADWGRFFARVDTLGVKTLPIGTGHLELVARISVEGFDADRASLRGVGDRSNPLPVGIGTLQTTPYGAFFLYAMHDFNSGGAYLEGTWGAEFAIGRVTVYPLLGLEYRGAAYVRHLYGIDAAQSAASGLPQYSPGASLVPIAGVAATVPIAGPWTAQLQWRHRWLDDAIRSSPIVGARGLHSGHVALTYTFK